MVWSDSSAGTAVISRCLLVLALLLALGSGFAEAARTIHAGPGDYREALNTLKPGDRLRLESGNYGDGLPLRDVHGEPGAPVIIEGPADGPAAVFRARPGANTVSLRDVSHIIIRNLELDGAGLPVAAVRGEATAESNHHVTLEGLLIRGHGIARGIVGIASFAPAWDWVIRDNYIVGAGTGMYLGDSDGGDPFIGGVIENNVVRDTIGYNIQIKHQVPRERVPGMPVEPQQTIIRNNVLSKASGGSRSHPRPNLLLGHWPLKGIGQDDRYLVYGNFFHRNPTEALMQAEGNVYVYNNVFFNPDGPGLRFLAHNDVPRHIETLQNTIVASGVGIELASPHPEYEQRLAGNAVFAGEPLDIDADQPRVAVSQNVSGSLLDAARYLRAPDPEDGMPDLAPRGDVLRMGESQRPWAEHLPLGACDFEGRQRTAAIAGAYTARESPEWALDVEPKPPGVSPKEGCD